MSEYLDSTLPVIRCFGIKLFNSDDFLELVFRFAMNFIFVFAIARYIYFPATKRKDFLFTFLSMGAVVFLLCFLLSGVKLELGFALGLFAIFGIMRYRTDAIPIKEMTYLFIVIAVSVINALTNKKVSWAELGFTNIVITGIAFGLEHIWLTRQESSKLVIYEKIEMLKPENNEKLLTDLRERTGCNIHRFHIERIDFLRDIARIIIYYYDNQKK